MRNINLNSQAYEIRDALFGGHACRYQFIFYVVPWGVESLRLATEVQVFRNAPKFPLSLHVTSNIEPCHIETVKNDYAASN
jgi:hypothetical protein